MRSGVSYRLLLLVGFLSVSIFSLNTFAMLPEAVVSDQPQQLLQSAFATFPGENGKIAFMSNRDGDWEIYVMNADGTNPTRLTNNNVLDQHPDWSPDGTKIVFFSDSDDGSLGINYDIYVMNADGSGQTRLTNDPGDDWYPSWSPDGTKIAFVRGNNIYVMNADGSVQTRLTDGINDNDPQWSPDGTKIAFFGQPETSDLEIYVMNADGSNLARLTNNPSPDYFPDWSPDGRRIAFTSTRQGDTWSQIYVMNADGSNPTRLTGFDTNVDDNHNQQPSWSPDGTKIAFVSQRDDGIEEIYVMNADGTRHTNISNNPALELHPDWGSTGAPPPADTTPPVLTVPDEITAQATTANGGIVVTYNVTAEDNVDGTAILEEDNTITQDDVGGDIDISCDPSSGTEFQIGETVVECTATDSAGNIGTGSFTITVLPPPPDPLTAELTSTPTEGVAPATFEFEAMVTGGTPPYTYSWDFGDGTTEEESIEPTTSHTYDEPGTYTVTLTVIDSEGQEATDSLEVTVNEQTTEPPPPPPTTPREAIERLISYIENLEDVPDSAKTRLTSVLERALALLTDNNARNDASACNMLGSAFINQVNANERRGSVTEDQAADVRTQVEDIRDMMGC